MKKENEVLQAAQSGNLTKLEHLFEVRSPKVLAGFFKGPNINWRDESGCTALHLAALNGHTDCVIYLLHNDASANTPDNAGSFPLHLAAFNGHDEVAKILLEKGPSIAQVNEPNMAGDTALHVAALYNHFNVMDVLLKHHADIFLRNDKAETALDLAAQYGRYLAVQMLIFKDTRILKDAVHRHSPLHLAARNGHTEVVKLLLDSGMPINATCDMGTALHASALFGKVEVAKLLLRRGVDIEIENNNGEKVLDLLCKIPSQRSQQITALIYEQSDLMLLEAENTFPATKSIERSKIKVSDDPQIISTPGNQRPKRNPLDNYDYVPKFRDRSLKGGSYPYAVVEGIGKGRRRPSENSKEYDLASLTGNKEKDKVEENTAPYCLVDCNMQRKEAGIENLKLKQPLTSEKVHEFETDSIKSECLDDDVYVDLKLQGVYSHPVNTEATDVKESFYDVPPKSNWGSSYRSSIPIFPPPSPDTASATIADVFRTPAMSSRQPVLESAHDDAHEDIMNNNEQAMLTDAAYNLLGIKPLCKSVPVNIGIQGNINKAVNLSDVRTNSYDAYDNVKLKNVPAFEIYDNANLSGVAAQDSYDNVHIKNIPSSSFFNGDGNNTNNHEKCIKQKRTTSMINIPTEQNSLSNKSSPNSSERKITNNVYQTTSVTHNSDKIKTMNNVSPTPVPKPRTKLKQSRTNSKNVSTGYRMSNVNNKAPMDEGYEWNKIEKFVSELELYAEEGTEDEEKKHLAPTSSLSAWLDSIGLIQYEPMLLTNGFDDIAFLNGVLTDQDLIELGIVHSGHRERILEASQILPKSPVLGDGDFLTADSISKWLEILKLSEYERRFIQYGYDNMERIRVIWELELVTVLEITSIGHRKRIISSLGSPIKKKELLTWSHKLGNADATKKKSFIDDSMDVAKQLLETAESLKVERIQRLSKQDEVSADKAWIPSPIEDHQYKSVSPIIEWKHSNEFLLKNSVSYVVQYLGSHPVQKVQGVVSTLEACTKMKLISRNIHKMPFVMLAISVRGIDYIDSNSNMVISRYAIRDISYCAQDPNELNIFAYITRDECTRKKYCHVFRVDSVNIADEIIITIGQCFELAYKQHLKVVENAKRENSENTNIKLSSSTPNLSSQNGSKESGSPRQTTKRVPPRPPKPYAGKFATLDRKN